MVSMGWTLFAMILLGAITFCYRFSFISSWGKKWADRIPADFLRLLAPATFTAIVVNNIVSQPAEPAEFRLKILVSLLSMVVAYWTRSILMTLLFGLILLYLLQNFAGNMIH